MPEQQAPAFMHMFMLVFIFIAFYFFIIAPQRKQQRRHQEMIKNLSKNDRVVTLGGIHGVVLQIKEKTLTVRIDESTRIEIDKTAISYKLEKS